MDLKIYYGDADQDMEAALEANIQWISVLRPKIASKKTGYRVGYDDEPILIDSDFNLSNETRNTLCTSI